MKAVATLLRLDPRDRPSIPVGERPWQRAMRFVEEHRHLFIEDEESISTLELHLRAELVESEINARLEERRGA